MHPDETMAEIMATTAAAAARRTGLIQFVEHNGACWNLRAQGAPPMPGADSLAVVLPGEDPMGIAKRILGAKQSGLHVPAAVMQLVTPIAPPPPPKPPRPTKAELARAVSPPASEPSRSVEARESSTANRAAPVPHDLPAPATIQRELF
jgi:hypothetical protein